MLIQDLFFNCVDMFFCLYSIFETSFCLGPYSLIDKISDYNVESCPSWDVVPKKKKKFS